MKLAIEKAAHGSLMVEVSTDSGKKPLVFNLDKFQIETALQLLQMARRPETAVKLTLEI
jgi:hypothetical protein